jgi:hypothetical protein
MPCRIYGGPVVVGSASTAFTNLAMLRYQTSEASESNFFSVVGFVPSCHHAIMRAL